MNRTEGNQGVGCFIAFGSLLALTSILDDDRRRDPRGFDSRDRNSRPGYQNGIPTGPRADRDKPSTSHRSGMLPPPVPAPASITQQGTASKQAPTTEQMSADSSMSSAELSAIRSRYLGVDKKKRQIRKMSDRKFVFDWSEQDDTFSSDSPSAVGGARQGAAVMFGRGHLAGMDLDAAHATVAPGGKLSSGDRKKGVADERHWSEKPLSDMKERDWRIFREDFSITARGTFFPSGDPSELMKIPQGGQIPLPLRSWEESSIPAPLLDVIASIGYKDPSPIQRQAIPIGLQNRDLIGIAETGATWRQFSILSMPDLSPQALVKPQHSSSRC